MIRIAVIGMGQRGKATVGRMGFVDGATVVAECDVETPWREVVERPDVDLVWICTPWEWHTRMAVASMRAGKDVALEVPAVMTVKECQEILFVAKETGRHCAILENCCYDTWHLGVKEMVRRGMLGRIKHMEGAYAHTVPEGWMRCYGRRHHGNPYPTHALGPMCQLLPEGDTLEYLVSLSSPVPGDHTNTSLIKSVSGVSMLLHYDISTPRPYSRMQTVCGMLGYVQKYPIPTLFLENGDVQLTGDEATSFVEGFISKKYKTMIAEGNRRGVANVMNYMMDCRMVEVMEQILSQRKDGLQEPSFDMDVYDAALWSSAVDLSALSASDGSRPVRFPTFS